jgi:hypothetical protein
MPCAKHVTLNGRHGRDANLWWPGFLQRSCSSQCKRAAAAELRRWQLGTRLESNPGSLSVGQAPHQMSNKSIQQISTPPECSMLSCRTCFRP